MTTMKFTQRPSIIIFKGTSLYFLKSDSLAPYSLGLSALELYYNALTRPLYPLIISWGTLIMFKAKKAALAAFLNSTLKGITYPIFDESDVKYEVERQLQPIDQLRVNIQILNFYLPWPVQPDDWLLLQQLHLSQLHGARCQPSK